MIHQKKAKANFLAALADTANVSHAAQVAGHGRVTFYRWRNDDPEFAAAWDEAVELGTDALEDEAVRRASEGCLEPVFYKGEQCGSVRKYSDVLLIFMLKARRPEKYKDRAEYTVDDKLSESERTARVAALLERARARRDGQAAQGDEGQRVDTTSGTATGD